MYPLRATSNECPRGQTTRRSSRTNGWWQSRTGQRSMRGSALLLAFFFSDSRLHQLLHKSRRERLIHREADGTFGHFEMLEFLFEPPYHGVAHREQTAMVRKSGERQ